MKTRFLHTTQGILLGVMLAIATCAWAYLSTHQIKFTSTASNETPAVTMAAAIESMMPPLPPHKPAVQK